MAAPAPEAQESSIPFRLKETLVTPIGVNVTKMDVPTEDGKTTTAYTLKFILGLPAGPGAMVSFEINGYQLGEKEARDLATMLTGGIQIARADEIPK